MLSFLPNLLPDLESLLRLGMAVLCGLAVGFNRAHHGNLPHPNRLRVHVLVGLSACLVVLAAGHGADARSRAIQGVATGVGFLGAGEILVAPPRRGAHQPPEVHGLSSAASIWFTAALGVTVAAARPGMALVALVLALITLSDRRPGGGGPENGGGGVGPGPLNRFSDGSGTGGISGASGPLIRLRGASGTGRIRGGGGTGLLKGFTGASGTGGIAGGSDTGLLIWLRGASGTGRIRGGGGRRPLKGFSCVSGTS